MRLLYLLFSLLFCYTLHAFESNEEAEWLVNYRGDINDKYEIGMTLIFHGNSVRGVYFYNRYLEDIRLSGERRSGNKIRLFEYDNQENVTAIFEGILVDCASKDPRSRYGEDERPLDKEVIIGTWTRSSDGEQMPFYLGLNNATSRRKGEGRYSVAGARDDSLINQSAKDFRRAVRSNDKEKVASQISYPINVIIDGRGRRIKDENELIENYDKIFSISFRKRIEESVPHNMFVKYSGIMLGSGEIWFGAKGKVIQINNR